MTARSDPYEYRSQRDVEADKAALRRWVAAKQADYPRKLRLTERGDRLTLWDEDLPVAAFVHDPSGWWLRWRRSSGKWAPYDDEPHVSLAVPAMLVDVDEYGCFWG